MKPPTRRSAGVRHDRVACRAHLARGGSLAILLRERRDYLQGMPLRRLVRMIPGVGEAKATRILIGLNDFDRVRELTQADFHVLADRVASVERTALNRQLQEPTA